MLIQIMNQKSKEDMEKNAKDTLGITFFPDREIWLLNTLVDEQLKQVATHEVTHALLDEFSCNNIQSFNDEFICDFIANNNEMIIDIRNKILNLLE